MLKEYEIEFIDLSEEEDPANLFEPLFRHVTAGSNSAARSIFKKEMKEDFDSIEGKDYKIEHVTINKEIIRTRYSVYGISYQNACELINELKASGIESNITQGGIEIVTEGAFEIDVMNIICEKYNTVAKLGATPFEEDIVMRKREKKYEIGYKEGSDIFFTGQILTAKTQEDAIDQFMKIEPELIRENVRANRI